MTAMRCNEELQTRAIEALPPRRPRPPECELADDGEFERRIVAIGEMVARRPHDRRLQHIEKLGFVDRRLGCRFVELPIGFVELKVARSDSPKASFCLAASTTRKIARLSFDVCWLWRSAANASFCAPRLQE